MNKQKKVRRKQHYFYDFTLDLHGYNLEDAILELEKVLYSGRYGSIMIIHGVGSGILRRGIRKYLVENNFGKKYYNGEDLNLPGGNGVTIVEF